nr:hypothetical protein [Methylorubrum extorquens]
MRRARGVDDDRPAAPLAQVEAPGAQGLHEPGAVDRLLPGCQGGRAQVVEGHARALLDEALLRAQPGHRPGRRRRPGGPHPTGDVVPAGFPERGHDGPGVLRRRRPGHAVFALHDPGAALPPGEVEPNVDDRAVRAHERVDPVLVPAGVLDVDGPAERLPGEPELLLEEVPEAATRPVVVRDLGVGVAVDVVDRPVCPAAQRQGHELADLSDQVAGAEAPGREDQDLLVLDLEQVPGQGVAALAAHGAGDHRPSPE